MENALIVSYREKSTASLVEMVKAASVERIMILESAGAARRMVLEQDFDLVIVNVPLQDETGEDLARYIASKYVAQVILVVPSEHLDAVSAVCEGDGVLTISRPVNKAVFWSALKLAGAVQNRLKRIQAENSKLKQQIEDIRIIHRAKCLLMSRHNMSEQKAHRYIEKQAMDMRSSRRAVAERILEVYENYQETE